MFFKMLNLSNYANRKAYLLTATYVSSATLFLQIYCMTQRSYEIVGCWQLIRGVNETIFH